MKGLSSSHQVDGCHIHRRWSDLRHATTGTAESKEAVLDLRKKSTRVQVSQRRRHWLRRRQRSVCHRAGLRSHHPSVNAKPNSRQQCCLLLKILVASVELLPPRLLTCRGSSPAICSAWSRAVPSKGGMPLHHTLKLAGVLPTLEAVLDKPRNSRSLEEEFEVGLGVAISKWSTPKFSTAADQEETDPATERLCPSAAHSAHPSRVPRSDHCDARDVSTGRLDDSPRRILELLSSVWSFPNSTKSHRDDLRSFRRLQSRRFRLACDVVLDLRDTRIWSEGQRFFSLLVLEVAFLPRPAKKK